MFRESANARTFLRTAVETGLAFLGALQVAIFDGSISGMEWVGISTATLTAFGGYLGIGAASGSVEPFFVNELENAEVPSPPAVRDA
jgi:hypothetical protein